MKKSFLLILASLFAIFALAGCADESKNDTPAPTPTVTPKKEDDTKKINISIDLSSKGERDSFVVKVILEGQAVGGKKYEYEKRHKRSDGTITVPVTYSQGAMVKVYIDDVLDSEQIL